MTKWLFSDYDGTLRNGNNGEVDQNDLNFVKNFITDDNRFVLASGRPYQHMLLEAKRLNLKPTLYVTNAGAIIRNQNGDLLFKRTLPQEVIKPLTSYLQTMNLDTLIYATPEEEFYLFSKSRKNFELGKLTRKVTNLEFSALDDMELVCFKVSDTREKLDNLISYVKKIAPELTIINNSDSHLVEIHPPKSSKGHAIKVIQAMFHLREAQIMTAGDDANDITMLSWFTHSFVIKQPYNLAIQQYGKQKINHLWEIQNYLEQN